MAEVFSPRVQPEDIDPSPTPTDGRGFRSGTAWFPPIIMLVAFVKLKHS